MAAWKRPRRSFPPCRSRGRLMQASIALNAGSGPSLARAVVIAGVVAVHAALLVLLSLPVTAPLRSAMGGSDDEIVEVAMPPIAPLIIGCGFGWERMQARERERRLMTIQGAIRSSVSPVPASDPIVPNVFGRVVSPETAAMPAFADTVLRILAAPAPAYPLQARRDRLSGVVEIEVLVGVDGKALSVSIVHSSGHRVLDLAAREVVMKRWLFEPATRGGVPAQALTRVPIEFVLEG
ncbi:energy transducer TonB [Lysobacter sp. 1R34A]|uniref:energy transducer TonB n=1 Tax=Lysobacter sp. 1R34A TaxID=3445786 RepID=UPI003EE9B473